MNGSYENSTGDIFIDEMDRRIEVLDKVQEELSQASKKIVNRMAKTIAVTLNKTMASYVDEVLAYRKLTFIDMVSVKHQSLTYAEIQIGFEEELDARIESQVEALSPVEWLVFQFRDAGMYYEKGITAVKNSVKADVLDEFGKVLDEHFQTKRMQNFLERYPWINR